MAHTLYTPEQAAKSMLAALRYLSVLPRTVNQDISDEFIAGRGQTINVLKPISAGEAKIYTKAKRDARDSIEFNELLQEWIPVKIEDQVYNAVRLPDDWATFTLDQLQKKVIVPQAESVVDVLANPLISAMVTTKAPTVSGSGADVAHTAATALKFYDDGSNALKVIIRLRKELNKRNVPATGRTLAVGAGVEAAILQLPQLQKANEAGDGGSMLREATIGKLFGFTIVADAKLPEDFAVAYTRDAFAFITRVSRVPEGAPFGTTIAQDGFTLRHIMQYNPLQLEDQSIVDTFYAGTVLDGRMAVAAGLTEAPTGSGE